MATTRIKDLSKTATTLAADSNFVIDGSTNGTQKITTGNVKADIATSFAGDLSTYGIATLGSDNKLNPDQLPDSVTNGINFVGTADSGSDLTSTTQGDFYIVNTAFTHLSISYAVGDSAVYNGSAYVKVTPGTTQIGEGGTGASTLDGAKANLEIPDVGTAPNEVPLNGQLGSLAYQSAEAVSVAELEVTDSVTDSLTIEDSNDPTLFLERAGIPNGFIKSVDANGTETSGIQLYSSEVRLRTGATTRWTINSSGNLVAGSGLGVDFGSTTTGSGTVTGGLLNDYEEGTFTPTLTPTTSGSITLDSGWDTLSYTKVGRMVTIMGQIKISSVSSPVGQTTMSLPFTIRSIDNVDYSNMVGGAVSFFDATTSVFDTTVYNGNQGDAFIYLPLPAFEANDQLRFSFSFLAA